jgi:hypothetical protein
MKVRKKDFCPIVKSLHQWLSEESMLRNISDGIEVCKNKRAVPLSLVSELSSHLQPTTTHSYVVE